MAKRFFAFLLCIVFAFSSVLITPAYADSGSESGSIFTGDFFSWVFEAGYHTMAGILSPFFEQICPSAPGFTDKHSFVERRTTVNGKTGLFYICEYCGKSAGEVGQDAYTDYVGTLPATGYNSDGSLLLYPVHKHMDYDISADYRLACSHYTGKDTKPSIASSDPYFDCDNNMLEIKPKVGYTSFSFPAYVDAYYTFYFPIDGMYSIVNGKSYSGRYVDVNNENVLFSSEFTGYGSSHYYSSGTEFTFSIRESSFMYRSYIYFYIQFGTPTCKVIPYDSIKGDINEMYNITTRPTTITGGNYGIVGDNGQLTVVNGDIINETNNTYYNPATGQGDTITNWSYDYSDRSYNITLESGDTVTVTYGDENITINEGDTVYNIYYIMDGSGSGSDPDCSHEWELTNCIEGNCVNPEKRTYTCKLCGKQYTETDSVLGHSWRIIQDVSTKYDEEGNLIQEGYTVYECERCGEQYKSTNDTGPPPSGGGGSGDIDDGGLLDFFDNIIKYLSEHFSGAVDLILSFFRVIPEMFGGFLDFLSAMFPFLPDDVMFLLTFGIAAVVFVGIIKAIRR